MTTTAPTRPARTALPRLVLAVVVVVALAVRWQLLDVTSGDYRAFVLPWYERLASGGFAALAGDFSNYDTPYLVLLWLAGHVPVEPVVAIKGLSVAFDLVLVGFTHALARRLRPTSRWLPTVVTAVVLLLPTVVLNSSAWAQCDSIYASCCVASLHLLLVRRPWWACIAFGLAFAFKLQAVFFLPVLVAVLLVTRQQLLSLLGVPATFVAALVPALVAGRSLASQLAVYPAQIRDTGGAGGVAGAAPAAGRGRFGGGAGGPGQGGGFGGGGAPTAGSSGFGGGSSAGTLTRNAPTWYAWLPSDAGSVWRYLGLALAAAVVVGFGVWLLHRRARGHGLDGGQTVLLAATAVLAVPLLLPQMHERYFYVAEVLLVVACVVDRRYLLPAAAVQVASISTYARYLGWGELLPLPVAAGVALAGALVAVLLLVANLRRRPAPAPPLSGPPLSGPPLPAPPPAPAGVPVASASAG